ncbi:MAG: hypothetical protein JOZ63_16230 [Planctomycetaceae bacterium]|nr:hypothetical protein [Planctomycetaceae bacterium]
MLDGLAEPVFGPEVESVHPLNRAHSKDIPPSLVARMRLGASSDTDSRDFLRSVC